MPFHRVQQGECLSTLAARFGIARWQTLFDHPANAGLKETRRNPNVLLAGDEVFVPDRETRQARRPTGETHAFKLKTPRAKVRLALRAHDGAPHVGARWVLEAGEERFADSTGDDGIIEVDLPLTVTRCLVSVWYAPSDQETTDEDFGIEARPGGDAIEEGQPEPDEDEEPAPDAHLLLLLGHLDPHDSFSGVQARLRNLGFGASSTGELDEPTRAAIREFRLANKLGTAEIVDDALACRLRDLHDGQP